ncbi:MAG: NAD(P)/FAD-dependent oxidoreductase [Candidatus Aminicenantaceae bacterium]
MRIVVIGNGIAGVMSSKTLRDLDKNIDIDIFADEKYHYYPRPNLIEFLAEKIPYERIFAFSEDWYDKQNINVHLGSPVERILPDSNEIELSTGQREKYDKLLLACGSHSFIPPIKGAEKEGVFTLRTIEDAFQIQDYIKTHQKVSVIGGGVLGLEIARALKSKGAEIEVIEFFERLLPRQLDSQGASLLKSQIENMGIKVHLGMATEEILGQKQVHGLKFKNGREFKTDMSIIAAGVRSNLDIAKEAGLEIDRGLVVNDNLRTSNPEIFGAGDVIQHKDKMYGIIPASFAQAQTAAYNILGQNKKYEGTIMSNTLKVMGISLTSIGLVNPEEKTYEEFREVDKEKGVYKKIVVRDGIIVGAIWLGTKEGANQINRLITQKVDISKWKDSILEDDFDFSII